MLEDTIHTGMPAPTELRIELSRILADSRFTGSVRVAAFLRYVVEKTLEGEAAGIKEVTIATELYGRPGDYDPKVDSIVRVEATRLRSKLRDYYEHQGAENPVRIVIPKGSYVPRFEGRPPSAGDRRAPALSRRPGTRWLWAALAVIGLVTPPWLWRESAQRQAQGRTTRRSAAHTPDPQALRAWQEGNELLALDPNNSSTDHSLPATLQRAVERYEFAIARDPLFDRAWASVAEVYEYAAAYAGRDHAEDTRRAEAAARHAVALNDNVAVSHAMLAMVLFYLRWDFEGAEREYRRAIELDPRSAFTIVEFADLLRETGCLEEAANQIRTARALMPDTPVLAAKEAEIYLEKNQPDAAMAAASAALQVSRDYRRAHVALGMAWELKGDFTRAIRHYRDALVMHPQDRQALPALGYALGRLGRIREAHAVARELEDRNQRVRNYSCHIALVYTGTGEYDRALDWLERAWQTRHMHLPFAVVEHRFAPLRPHPRFRAILARVGLPRSAAPWLH